MLKILHVTPSFYPAVVYGGPIHSVYELCRGLLCQGCQVRVLTTDANGPHTVLDVNTKTEVEVLPELLVRYCHRLIDVSVSPTLLRLLASRIRWAHVVHLMAVYSFPTIPTLAICKILRKPVVWSPRGMLQRWEGSGRRRLKRLWEDVCHLAAPETLVLHVTSEEEARATKSRFPGIDSVVIPNGVQIADKVTRHINRRELRLVYLGRLHPQKGIENLLSAYKIAYGDLNMMSSLIIAGSGEPWYSEKIRVRIEELGLSQHVKLIGSVAGKAKQTLFEHADVVVVPSYMESFCLVVAEALAHGVPVIASRGTPWKRVEDVGCGLWVDNNPESLGSAIKRISLMPRDEMGIKGREWMQREFASDLVAAKMMQVYREVVRTA